MIVGLAVFLYVAFVLLIIYVKRFEYPWFGGYANIVGVTFLYLLFAGVIVQQLYGKKKDPYQSSEDRMRSIGLSVKTAVYSSILATTFISMNIVLSALELRDLIPVSQSLYFQLCAVLMFRALRIDDVDFEVYREDLLVT